MPHCSAMLSKACFAITVSSLMMWRRRYTKVYPENWSTKTIAYLYHCCVSLPLSWAMKPWVLDSNWSTETICLGRVAVFVAFLSSPLTLHGRFVILPYWQAVQKGFLDVRRRLGSCPSRQLLMRLNDK